MLLDQTTISLFPTFPREVGTPYRTTVRNVEELKTFLNVNDGINDCYISLYDDTRTIDKLFYDLDYGKSLLVSKYLYQVWYDDMGLPVIPTASGRKGEHLYIKTKVHKCDNELESKELLEKAAFGMLWMALEHLPKEVDTSVIGDIRRITRIPGTKRPPKNINYCTYLPKDFHNFKDNLNAFIRKPHYYDYSNKRIPINIEEFADFDIEKHFPHFNRVQNPQGGGTEMGDEGGIVAPWNLINYLKPLIRECLLSHIIRLNPKNVVRVATTQELLQVFDPERVVSIYRKIGWDDWDEDYTRYQVYKRLGKKPYGNKKLFRKYIHNYNCSCDTGGL